ncbi:hypothetical protein UO65_1062 [Actinokineospora spheciospongiae]|uniref:Uncharacterized protein n=1 Tax=Actinokineospora spheciospongiae TaxID=909613 RepID=W7ITD1_9PSEU|nr:hypothetical protein UO65_1062 [Actinokineospora spheciospongiae]
MAAVAGHLLLGQLLRRLHERRQTAWHRLLLEHGCGPAGTGCRHRN